MMLYAIALKHAARAHWTLEPQLYDTLEAAAATARRWEEVGSTATRIIALTAEYTVQEPTS